MVYARMGRARRQLQTLRTGYTNTVDRVWLSVGLRCEARFPKAIGSRSANCRMVAIVMGGAAGALNPFFTCDPLWGLRERGAGCGVGNRSDRMRRVRPEDMPLARHLATITQTDLHFNKVAFLALAKAQHYLHLGTDCVVGDRSSIKIVQCSRSLIFCAGPCLLSLSSSMLHQMDRSESCGVDALEISAGVPGLILQFSVYHHLDICAAGIIS